EMMQVPDTFFYVGNASVKKQLLERAGRFDERFMHHAFDDFEFGFRLREAGMKSGFVRSASVTHIHNIVLRDRENAVRESGLAAKPYVHGHPENRRRVQGPKLPLWLHRCRVASTHLYFAACRTDNARAKWWQARLDAAFVEGYENGS